ncbi:D-alanine--D-alanine ligase family protein [Patescibacteria group bacterium]
MPKKKKLTVGVIFGGRSAEHEVSIASARSVIKALNKKLYHVVPIAVTKNGRWLSSSNALQLLADSDNQLKKAPERTIIPNPTTQGLVTIKNNAQQAVKSLDVVFPLIHGPFGEDGSLQGLLELANIPYVGAGVLGSATGLDKAVMKRLFIVAGLPVGEFISFVQAEWTRDRKTVVKEIKQMKYPLFVKPANLGSSVGISKVHNDNQLFKAIKLALSFDRKVVVEKAMKGARDIECAVLGNDFPKASIPGEIVSSNEFYDYDAKYVDGESQAVIPAKLPKMLLKRIQDMSIRAFQALDISGMARVDFLVYGKTLWINELNTIPGFTSISMYPQLWEASRFPYPKLLDTLLELAIERHNQKRQLKNSYRPKKLWHRS